MADETTIVRLAHATGFPVYVWTVNDPADMRYLIRIAAKGIITTCPNMLTGILHEDEE